MALYIERNITFIISSKHFEIRTTHILFVIKRNYKNISSRKKKERIKDNLRERESIYVLINTWFVFVFSQSRIGKNLFVFLYILSKAN